MLEPKTAHSEPGFAPPEVARLHQWQFGPWANPFTQLPHGAPVQMHPFTCPDNAAHAVASGKDPVLVPTVRGWICQYCDYTQDWAHPVMLKTP